MNKNNIEELSAGTITDSNSTDQNQQVSQPNANTNVVGSLLGQREIKFRGQTIGGFWVYGNLSLLPKRVKNIEAGSYISNAAGLPFAYNVRPETVTQFTGLKDKNGKERFEGDIIKRSTGYIFVEKVIEFRMGDRNCATCFGYNYHKDDEVVGNIFENPELLQALR